MKIPFLHNVRRGLATNSSSSHSLVFHPRPVASDSLDFGYSEFGWDNFYLDTLGEKLMYALTSAVSGSWEYSSTHDNPDLEDVARAKEKWGHLFPEITDDEVWLKAMNGYVDHQSLEIDIPALVAKVRDPHVVIEGGNDNDGYEDRHTPEGATRESLGW